MQHASLQLLSPGAGSRSSDLPPQPVPGSCRHGLPLHTANPRLHRCPVVLARLLLSFSSTCLLSLGREREAGSSRLQRRWRRTCPAPPQALVTLPPKATCHLGPRVKWEVWCLNTYGVQNSIFSLIFILRNRWAIFLLEKFSTKLNVKQISGVDNFNLVDKTGKA